MKRALFLAVLFGAAAWGQRPEFDVASLKPVVLDGVDTYTANLGTYRNGVVTLTNTTLAECIRFAYDITSDDLLSGRNGSRTRAYVSTSWPRPRPTRRAARRFSCCGRLLEDRFKLVLRREPRVLSYYALTAPNGADKLQPAQDPPAAGGNSLGLGRIHHKSISMLLLATLIARFTRTPVLDQTAMPGFFEVKLDWARDNGMPPAAAPDAAPAEMPDGPSIFEAVQKQLGLKLEKRKGPVDVLVVDHAEKTPLAN